jgi:2-haloacid dehalogenase
MPEHSNLKNVKACVFDAYGTLFDVHSAVGRFRPRLGDRADRVSTIWRVKQLEYTWLRSLMGSHADFWQVTGEALDYALASCGIEDRKLLQDLMEAYLYLDCYPEVPETLARLKNSGLPLAILSNGAPKMLASAVNEGGLKGLFVGVFSVEEVGVFKPDPRVYRLAADRLGLETGQIVFLSSNSWDVVGAAAFGLRVVWVNRFGQIPERLPFGPDAEIRTLDELPALLGR